MGAVAPASFYLQFSCRTRDGVLARPNIGSALHQQIWTVPRAEAYPIVTPLCRQNLWSGRRKQKENTLLLCYGGGESEKRTTRSRKRAAWGRPEISKGFLEGVFFSGDNLALKTYRTLCASEKRVVGRRIFVRFDPPRRRHRCGGVSFC